MNTEVSLILIAYNKFPQVLYTLYALQNQTYEQGKMEVILVDDGSTDQTPSLQNYTAPFRFTYLRSNKSLDRAGARNLGLQEARGEIVIFLDGEILADPHFVAHHVRHYRTNAKVAVSGTSSHFCTFSIVDPRFTEGQLGHLYSLISHQPLFLQRAARRLGLSYDRAKDMDLFIKCVRKNEQLIPLLTREDIEKQRYRELSFPLPSFPRVYKKFPSCLSGYHLAWTFFITRNVSVRKSLLNLVGPFNEAFKGWGYEDWEMGFRLYREGVRFIEDREIVTFHQEHPFSPAKRQDDQMRNYSLFVQLHPEVEVCAFALDLLRKRSLLQIHEIIEEYCRLEDTHPYAKDAFIRLTKQIPLLLAQQKPAARLLQHAGLESEAGTRENLFAELAALRKARTHPHFLKALELLMQL